MVSEGGTAVRKGGAGVLVNNLHSQNPPAGPPLEELEDTTLAGLLFLRFFFTNKKAIVPNEASNSIGELMACMRRSVWTVNLPVLYQYDKQRCGVAEKAGKSGHWGF